jgi:hypothetical protein
MDDHSILDRLRIRRMTGDEVEFAIDLAAEGGWNPGIHDGECFYVADPNGFFVGELDGELVGCLSAVSYGDSFGFIGLFCKARVSWERDWHTDRERRHGILSRSQHRLGRCGGAATVVSEAGFSYCISQPTIRRRGRGGSQPEGVVEISEVPFEKLFEYDTSVFSSP